MEEHVDRNNGRMFTPTKKAYNNSDFIKSSQARKIRVICENAETLVRLQKNNIEASVLFVGTARAKDQEGWEMQMAKAKAEVAEATDDESRKAAEKNLAKWRKCEWMGEYVDKVSKLAELVTQWAMERRFILEHKLSFMDPCYTDKKLSLHFELDLHEENGPEQGQHLVVCTGGGPGFMEAANKGASRVPGSRNMGMGITLPFEQGLNPYVTEDLAFEFHYFFTRKFWMLYHCQALVVAPGGFGTLDELFEVLRLKRTEKLQSTLPVILFGKKYWQTVINWDALVEFGTVDQEDVDSLFFTDDPEEALVFLMEWLSTGNLGNDEDL